MTKWYIEFSEWWPVFSLKKANDGEQTPQEFTDEELADLKRVWAEFDAWQDKIAERFGTGHTGVNSAAVDEDEYDEDGQLKRPAAQGAQSPAGTVR